jgi:PIN domain nuclease of toxin-antitoxin system
MKLLLDTHVLLWALAEPKRIPLEVQRLIASASNQTFASVVSLFEIAVRGPAARRLKLNIDAETVRRRSIDARFEIVSIGPEHAIATETLAGFHGDPFDRLLLAQAQVEDMRLVTHDESIAAYDPRTIIF